VKAFQTDLNVCFDSARL